MIAVLMILWALVVVLLVAVGCALVWASGRDYREGRDQAGRRLTPRRPDEVLADFLNHPDRYEDRERDARYEP